MWLLAGGPRHCEALLSVVGNEFMKGPFPFLADLWFPLEPGTDLPQRQRSAQGSPLVQVAPLSINPGSLWGGKASLGLSQKEESRKPKEGQEATRERVTQESNLRWITAKEL